MSKLNNTCEQGKNAESLAWLYLQKQSLKPVIQNYRTKHGEIDLIMRDKHHLVFVEVRLRNNTTYGSGADTISLSKQRRLRNTAHHYLQSHFGDHFPACRFDVISMSMQHEETRYEWIKDAF